MTPEQQLTIREQLARAMGWRQGEASGIWFSPSNSPELCVYDEPPDPFTNAEDRDALVAWLAVQAKSVRWAFDSALMELIDPDDKGFDYIEPVAVPRETITICAARALGIPEASE